MKNLTKILIIFTVGLFLIGCSSSIKPTPFIPERCMMGPPAGAACVDYAAQASGILDIVMQNSMGRPISNVNLNIGGICEPKGVAIDFNQNQKFTCKIPAGNSGSKFESEIKMIYTDENGQSQLIPGKIVAKYN